MFSLRKITYKKGAVFGIDARIGLVLVSIASLAIALNKQSLTESNRIKEISLRLLEAEDAIMQEYKKNYKKSAFITKDYTALTALEKKELWQGKTELYTDPWGNNWGLKVFTSTDSALTAFGELIEPVCVVIFSAGADGHDYKYQNYTAANYDDCTNNVGLTYSATESEVSDDYFYKFTTIAYEVEINQDLEQRINEIQQALVNYSDSKKNARIKYCNDLSQSSANSDTKCDADANGTYVQAELNSLNFMPKSSKDGTLAKYGEATVYDNTAIADLEALMVELGLPKAYAKDLAGRQLDYHSNSTTVITAPYIASFYYKAI